MLAYLLLVLFSTLAGFGVLSASGVTLGPAQRWYLSPGACLVAWAVTIGIGVSAGVPVRDLAMPVWLATGVAAAYGAWRARIEWTSEAGIPLAVIFAIPIGLMAYDFAHGLANYIGGPAADGWSYVAYGQYLWELPKGTEGSLSPLHQYATHAAWMEDHRREDNGQLCHRALGLALAHPVSRRGWKGYWQRSTSTS